MRGDARRFRLVASRLLYEPEKAHFAPTALRFVRNVAFVEEAGQFENFKALRLMPPTPEGARVRGDKSRRDEMR